MAAGKKYFWLRLKKDFFYRHDIRILESMPNGKEYVLFYLKLMAESVSHDGKLRFSEKIPYTVSMLASVTNTEVGIVDDALELLEELNIVEIMDDKTIFLPEVVDMIGTMTSDEHTRESTRNRVREFRKKKKEESERCSNVTDDVTERYSNVTCNGELEKELEIETELDINNITNITKEHNNERPLVLKHYMMEGIYDD